MLSKNYVNVPSEVETEFLKLYGLYCTFQQGIAPRTVPTQNRNRASDMAVAYMRDALTKEQQKSYLQFVQDCGGNYYDDIVILLGTGLHVSELCGLTQSDLDFERRQLCWAAEKPYFVTPPKTKSGIRNIPMTNTVYMALMRVVEGRTSQKVELLVDGHSGFLFLDKSGMPKVAMHLENYMRGIQKKVNRLYGASFLCVTPHVLRHTFCTNMQQALMQRVCNISWDTLMSASRWMFTPIPISTPCKKRSPRLRQAFKRRNVTLQTCYFLQI